MPSTEQHRSTARVLDILELLADAPNGRTLTELSTALDAPKSSLFPIIHTLAERKYIKTVGDSGRYTIGISTCALGVGTAQRKDLLSLTLELIAALTQRCKETCQLAILEGANALYIGKVDSPQAIRLISHVGTRLPAHATALGKALLSGLSDTEVRARFPEGLPRLTKNTITDMDALLAQLEQSRQNGYASECEESSEHITCLAVPLRHRGKVFAALSVSVPLFRYSEEFKTLAVDGLVDTKRSIEQMVAECNLAQDEVF